MTERVLMIAHADSFWTKQYIEFILLPQGYEVVLFPIWENEGIYQEFYEENGVSVYEDKHALPLVRHVPRLRMWVRIALNARALAKLGPFTVIHNHYPSQRDLALGKAVHKRFPKAKWICSFWGSDLLRSSALQQRQMLPYLKHCSLVTIPSGFLFPMVQKFYGSKIEKKTVLVYFGLTIFEDIDRVRSVADQAACKAHFGIDPKRKVVCIGYNATSAQRQPEVLRALAKLPSDVLQNLTVILQLTYGVDDPAYIQAVRDAAGELPAQTLIYTEFMDRTESSYLRLAADAFILAITTDSFSASFREYLYAGAKALVGSWLQYPHLAELGIELLPFSEFEELPALLEEALKEPLSQEQSQRRAQLREKYSWDAVRNSWLKLY